MSVSSCASSCSSPSSTESEALLCFCGQECPPTDGEVPIYCSKACARKDAMIALEAREDDCDHNMPSEDSGICPVKRPNDSGIFVKADMNVNDRLSITTASSHHPILSKSSSTIKPIAARSLLIAQGVSHYRRTRAMQRDYPSQEVPQRNEVPSLARANRIRLTRCSVEVANGRQSRHFLAAGLGKPKSRLSEDGNLDGDLDFGPDEHEDHRFMCWGPARASHQLRIKKEIQRGHREERPKSCLSSYTMAESFRTSTPDVDWYENPVGWEGGSITRASNCLGLFGVPSESELASSQWRRSLLPTEEEVPMTVSRSAGLSCTTLPELVGRGRGAKLHIKPLPWVSLDDRAQQRQFIADASTCATNLLGTTPTTPTRSLKRLLSSPSRKCTALFFNKKRSTKQSFPSGITNTDKHLVSPTREKELETSAA